MRYKLFVLTILASVGFFNFKGMLTDSTIKLIFYLMVVLSVGVAFKDGPSLKDVKYPRTTYIVLLASIAFSAIMGSAFHPQSLSVSVMTTLPILFSYAYFYVLMKSDIPRDKIMHTYLIFAAISAVVYFCNVLTMPNNIFGKPILNEDLSRGIIRIPVVFIEFFPMLVFYAINRWLETKERKWFVVIAVAAVMIFLSVIRQIIALTAVLGLWFFFRNVSLWRKLTLIVVALLVVIVVLPQIPMYKTMLELSEDQHERQEENIRITAWRYYTYENQTNSLTPIFGNGIPSFGNSRWGIMMDSDTEVTECFAVDVGWAGFFWYFGAIATFSLLVLLIKALLKRKPPSRQYLNYWLIFVIVTSVASGPVLIFWQILDISVCLYLVYKPSDEPQNITSDEVYSDNHTQLQQRPRYPQLHRVNTEV